MLYCHGTEFKYKKQRKYKYYSSINKINKATYIYVHNGLSSIMKKIVQKWRLLGFEFVRYFSPAQQSNSMGEESKLRSARCRQPLHLARIGRGEGEVLI